MTQTQEMVDFIKENGRVESVEITSEFDISIGGMTEMYVNLSNRDEVEAEAVLVAGEPEAEDSVYKTVFEYVGEDG